MPSVKTRVALLNENYRTASGEVDQLLTDGGAGEAYQGKNNTLTALSSFATVGLMAVATTGPTFAAATIGTGLDYTATTLKAKTLVTTTTSTSFTASSTNANSVVQFSTLASFVIPSSTSVTFDDGTWIEIHQLGAGAVTPTAASTAVTLQVRAGAGTGTAGQYAIAAVRYMGSNTWRLTGDLV